MLDIAAPKDYGSGFIIADKPLQFAEHIFGTKQEASFDSADETVKSVTERVGAIAHMRQVHGDRVVYAKNSGLIEECDAIYTDNRDLWLAVKTADCVPVLVSSPAGVGVAHCGWRGLEKEILPKLLKTMMREFALAPIDLFVHVGPCISQSCYEVEEKFKNFFDEEFFSESEREGHVMLDLASIVRSQAMEVGLPDLNIYNSNLCTYSRDDLFHSYRRAKQSNDEGYRVQLSLVKRKDSPFGGAF